MVARGEEDRENVVEGGGIELRSKAETGISDERKQREDDEDVVVATASGAAKRVNSLILDGY